MAPDRRRIDRMARQNHFVLTRGQVEEAGASVTWIRAQVENRIWRRAYPGVYITHAGQVSWDTRVTAALRYAGRDAALSHATAADWWFEHDGTRQQRVANTVEVSIPASRAVMAQRGLRVHRRRTLPAVWPGRTPVIVPEETALDLVTLAKREDDVVGILTRAARTVEPGIMRDAVAGRARLRHRALVLDILAEVAEGVESPLERHYHRDVERDHGLPTSELQVRERLSRVWIRADCRYRRYRVRVELDGRLAHPGGRTDRDTWRDNAAVLATDEVTLRYRWSHVVGSPCATAAQVVSALRKGGWTGRPRPCGPGCPVR